MINNSFFQLDVVAVAENIPEKSLNLPSTNKGISLEIPHRNHGNIPETDSWYLEWIPRD